MNMKVKVLIISYFDKEIDREKLIHQNYVGFSSSYIRRDRFVCIFISLYFCNWIMLLNTFLELLWWDHLFIYM